MSLWFTADQMCIGNNHTGSVLFCKLQLKEQVSCIRLVSYVNPYISE